MHEYGSRVGVVIRATHQPIEPSPFEPEDSHAELLAGLVEDIPYDILQLDPLGDSDLVGLVVDGQLRVTYRKVSVYPRSSMVAQTILDRSITQAAKALSIVRNLHRAANGSVDGLTTRRTRQVPGSVESESITWKTDEYAPPPLANGDESAHRETTTTPIPMEFDMGPERRLLDDSVLTETLPSFFDHVKGLARAHQATDEEKK